ncbi:hypothetical protein [Yinghuangia seranimata]|uniref:hypothetical protein n=1 Tax=Yinghuangia seranimata TaxID=408067 RepID=UPI00248BC626|nr:hypothetical protein [Yinghuangia seranimata]MDI2131111.1 hypothetical protein [Yinghuangia seranimata]
MDATVALSLLRLAAADLAGAAWQRPSDARLVELALDAVLAGVESPSLTRLAGLARGEHREARELFARAAEELGLVPLLPDVLDAARWEAALWWAGRIVDGTLDPVEGLTLIVREAAAELDYPARLRPFVDALADAETQGPDATGQAALAAARAFVDAS